MTELAIGTALRFLALDATQEVAHRALMRLYAQRGRRVAALRQYQTCVAVLQRELGTEPEAETRQLYQDLVRRRDERGGEQGSPPKSSSLPRLAPPIAAGADASAAPTRVIGRNAELATLGAAFEETRWGRGRVIAIKRIDLGVRVVPAQRATRIHPLAALRTD